MSVRENLHAEGVSKETWETMQLWLTKVPPDEQNDSPHIYRSNIHYYLWYDGESVVGGCSFNYSQIPHEPIWALILLGDFKEMAYGIDMDVYRCGDLEYWRRVALETAPECAPLLKGERGLELLREAEKVLGLNP